MARDYFSILLFLHLFMLNSISAQTTAIIDPYFEQALIDLGIDSDGVINGSIATSDIADITILDISNKYIMDLTGIEDFTNLTELYCNNNWLNSGYPLSLSNNTNLKILNCSNQTYILGPTGRRGEFFLNVSQNAKLEYLDSSNNILYTLNVSNNTNLKTLNCSFDRITSLNLSQNTKLEYLNCSFQELINVSGEYTPFTDLTLGQNANLTTILFRGNHLGNLDISGISSLTYLDCSDNKLTGLSVSQQVNLEKLLCSYNQLTALNLANNIFLNEVICNNNQLSILNVKNGNNTLLSTFNAQNNPSLTCIEVDDANSANNGIAPYDNWLKDNTAIYLEDCENSTTIPDPAFEQALIYLGIDTDGIINGTVATADIAVITDLDLFSFGIQDLTGIQDFISLITLSCASNLLTNFDVSQNVNLQNLSCYDNQLTSLDLSKNINLINLSCSLNLLTNLDVNQNINLQFIQCWSNQLTQLDVSNNIDLQGLECYNNELMSLDVSQNVNLKHLLCMDNKLTNLNVKNGNNSILFLDAAQNSLLTCIQVDDADAANAGEAPYSSWVKDNIATYSEDCSTLGIDDELLAQSISLYPNPVSNILIIDSEIPIIKVEIYSILGKKIKEVNANFSDINIGNLSAGLYLIKIFSEKGGAFRKIIKS